VFFSFFETGTILDRTILTFLKYLQQRREKEGGLPFDVYQIEPDPKEKFLDTEIGQLCLDLSRDIMLLLGVAEPKEARLGQYSALKDVFDKIYRQRLLNFYLNNVKEFDFKPVGHWLENWREPAFRKSHYLKIKSNIRVLLAVINHFFFDDLERYFFYGFQSDKEKRITAEEICGKNNFKCHNVEVLRNLTTPVERAMLIHWFESEAAQDLKDLTREVFTNHRYYLLGWLKKASNTFDKIVSKVIIKTLYHRNSVRSSIATKRRDALKTRGEKRPASSKETFVSLDEVFDELARRKELIWTCPYLISVGTSKTKSVTIEMSLKLCSEAFTYEPIKKQWILKETSAFVDTCTQMGLDITKEIQTIIELGFLASDKAIAINRTQVTLDEYLAQRSASSTGTTVPGTKIDPPARGGRSGRNPSDRGRRGKKDNDQ
jgi:hypothetical protein